MDNATRLFWQNIRGALINQAKHLQEERAAVLAQAAEIQKMLEAESKLPISRVGITFTKDQEKIIGGMELDKTQKQKS